MAGDYVIPRGSVAKQSWELARQNTPPFSATETSESMAANDDNIADDVIDDTEKDTAVAVEQYAISSFGIDFDVEGLVRRLRKSEIFVPPFQREFVWNQRESSQFVESLLLGLPVPGVFLAKERQSEKLMIIDGQQRLKTLQFYYDGYFNPRPGLKKQEVFELSQVQPQFSGLTYAKLDSNDRIRLDNSVIHATIIKQESPKEEEDSSLYYVFGRLNTGGRKLSPQEIRTAIYHGPFIDLIEDLNGLKNWREVFGPENQRLKDRELILRFLALYFSSEQYARPMEEFLNGFCKRHRTDKAAFLNKAKTVFTNTMEISAEVLGKSAFRPARSINAAVFDSIAVGLARRLDAGPIQDVKGLRNAHKKLAGREDYSDVTSRATSDENSVAARLNLAINAFKSVK